MCLAGGVTGGQKGGVTGGVRGGLRSAKPFVHRCFGHLTGGVARKRKMTGKGGQMDTLDQLGQLARLTRRVEGAYPPVNAPVLFWLYG